MTRFANKKSYEYSSVDNTLIIHMRWWSRFDSSIISFQRGTQYLSIIKLQTKN